MVLKRRTKMNKGLEALGKAKDIISVSSRIKKEKDK